MLRITKSNKRGKYPVFYGIESILGQAFHGPSLGSLAMDVLLDRLLLQLRLTTLMRSVGLSNIVWVLFQQDNQFFIQTSDKNGVALVLIVARHTLSTLALYIHKHLFACASPVLIAPSDQAISLLGE